ncbi:ABC transporter ATP-binding protein [Hydrogenophaga sp. XSHU_21]|jgi:branched-chain amino acid transport system ATP-binding protein
MLKVSNLNVEIQGSHIIRNLSLEVRPGELVCLLGRNGAGKTTTLRTLMGYLRASSGGIQWKGKDIARLATWQIAQLGVGYSPEESEVYADLSVAENIELPTWTRTGGRPAAERIAEAYRVFPKLVGYKARGGAELSGGERKMVSIARALSLDAELLLLDEPFEGLSPAIIPFVADGISAIRASGKAIVMAECSLHHVPDYIDKLMVIERGELIYTGSLESALSDKNVMGIVAGVLEPEDIS